MKNTHKSPISRVNNYNSTLTDKQIQDKHHRDKVGGMWEKLGQLQIDFLIEEGLTPNCKLLDIGCGCLRGGIKFISFLNKGNYFGSDINESLLKAGKIEINEAKLNDKTPTLLLTDKFNFDPLATSFDYMIAFSLFTHLHMNLILRCLKNAHKHLKPNGKFYATFFIVHDNIEENPICHQPGNITTHFDMDPFHYSLSEINILANHVGFTAEYMNDFNHPRSQKMIKFSKN